MNPLEIDGVLPGTVGPSTGIWESLTEGAAASFDMASENQSTLGFRNEVRRRLDQSFRDANIELPTLSPNGTDVSGYIINRLIQERVENYDDGWLVNFFSHPGVANEDFAEQTYQRLLEADKQLQDLRNPDIKSIDGILQDVLAERGETAQRATVASETGGVTGWVGQFAGGVAGSMTLNDPLNILTLPIGGFGKSVGMRLLTEGVTQAGIEAINQYGAVAPTAEALGETHDDVLWNVALAGAGGAAFRGLTEGIGALARRAVPGDPGTLDIAPIDFTDSQLASMFESPNTNVRAGASSLVDDLFARSSSPYGTEPSALRQFNGELEDIHAIMSGRTSTAVARFLPEDSPSIEVIDLDTSIARERNPTVFEATEVAQTRLAELDDAIDAITTRIDNPRASDVAGAFNPTLAARIREIEDTIANSDFTDARRTGEIESLNAELRALLDRETGDAALRAQIADAIEAAEAPGLNEAVKRSRRQTVYELSQRLTNSNYGVVLRQKQEADAAELRGLVAERRQVAAQYSIARDALDAEIARVKLEREFRNNVLKAQPGTTTPSLLRFNPQRFRPDVRAAFRQTVEEVADTADEVAEALLPTMRTQAEAGPEMIDLGNGKTAAADTKISDPDNPDVEITMGELVKRMEDDAAMLEAMRVCSL